MSRAKWKKLPMLGTTVMDGRWHCVVAGPKPTFKSKACYCTLDDGVWFDDAGEKLPQGFAVTHIDFPPEIP